MPTITIRKPKPIACLTINGQIDFVGSWPLAQLRKKKVSHLPNVELHSHRHMVGISYCTKCEIPTQNPYLFKYNIYDYWKCECGQINFIKP